MYSRLYDSYMIYAIIIDDVHRRAVHDHDVRSKVYDPRRKDYGSDFVSSIVILFFNRYIIHLKWLKNCIE